jgi:hypothetical protein
MTQKKETPSRRKNFEPGGGAQYICRQLDEAQRLMHLTPFQRDMLRPILENVHNHGKKTATDARQSQH